MKKSVWFLIVIPMILGVLACSQIAQVAEDPYPMRIGQYWVFGGDVTTGSGKGMPVEWKMEVVDKFERGHVTGYLMLGHPSDLAFYDLDKPPARSEYAIVRVNDGRVYQGSKDLFTRLKDPNDYLGSLVTGWQLIFDFPLTTGKRFCESDQITRQDSSYCWVVTKEETVNIVNVIGVSGQKQYVRFLLNYSTLPDHIETTFVPGIGMTSYTYEHHGSPGSVQVVLREYFSGP
jgi:hypothetical protein